MPKHPCNPVFHETLPSVNLLSSRQPETIISQKLNQERNTLQTKKVVSKVTMKVSSV